MVVLESTLRPVDNDCMIFRVEIEREDDGRWLAEILELPGAMAYGNTRDDALARAKALALRAVAERLEHGEAGPDLSDITFRAAGPLGRARERAECSRRSSASDGE
jgi:predicted RNase H-like HicB family nuclease